MHIRPFEPEDQAAIEQLQEEGMAELDVLTPAGYFDDLASIAEAFEGGVFLVAEIEGAAAGMGGLTPEGEVVRMRVSASYRRQGIALALLNQLVERARALEMKRVFLHTLVSQQAAQNLYLKYGFHEAGRGKLHGNHVVAYALELN